MQELKEMIAKQLTSTNPQVPDNLVEFNFKQGMFLPIPPPGNTVVVFELQGTLLHKDSQEAQNQLIEQGIDRKYRTKFLFKHALNFSTLF